MIWWSESERKVSGGLGAAEALTVDRRAGETDCIDDSSLWRTGAVAAPRCKLRVSEGGSAEWHEDRRLGSHRPESTASAILIDQLTTRTHTRTRSVSLTLQSNMPHNRSSLGNQLYFSEAVKVNQIYGTVDLIILISGQHPDSFLLTWQHFSYVFSMTNGPLSLQHGVSLLVAPLVFYFRRPFSGSDYAHAGPLEATFMCLRRWDHTSAGALLCLFAVGRFLATQSWCILSSGINRESARHYVSRAIYLRFLLFSLQQRSCK